MLQIRPNVIKLFTNVIYEFYNKVQCLSQLSTTQVLYYSVGFWPYPQTLYQARKACQGQAL